MRSSYFSSGVFKFTIEFPEDLSSDSPEVYFDQHEQSQVFHPFIDQEFGFIDFPLIESERPNLSKILEFVRRMFYDLESLVREV